jgi:hypothetical protein
MESPHKHTEWKDTQSVAQTVTLPSVATWAEVTDYCIVDIGANASTNNITITPDGSDTINGVAAGMLIEVDGGTVFLRKHTSTGWRVVGTAD